MRRPKVELYNSNFEDISIIRQPAAQIKRIYEGKAYDAQRAGDEIMAEQLFQQAEHWYKLCN